MANFYQRVRNLFTDEQNRKSQEKLAHTDAIERMVGSNNVAESLIEKLVGMETDIRSQWAHYLATKPGDSIKINEHFKGRISAYNDIATAIRDLDNQGRIRVQTLPTLLNEESVARGVHLVAEAEIAQTDLESIASRMSLPEKALLVAAGHSVSSQHVGSDNPITDEMLHGEYRDSAGQFVRAYERANPGLDSTELYAKFQQEHKSVERAEAETTYCHLDAQVQQVVGASQASRSAEITQAVAISPSWLTHFVSPTRAQQVARETPGLERDFGVSL